MMGRMKGTVRWFDSEKGYGFADVEGYEFKEVFVHFSAIVMDGYKELSENDEIEFNPEQTEKGWHAREVTVDVTPPTKQANRFVVPADSPTVAARLIKKHYKDDGELNELIDELLVTG